MNTLKNILAATISVGLVGATTVATATSASAAQPVVVISTDACTQVAEAYANSHVGPRARPAIVGTLIGAGIGFFVGGYGFGTPIAGAAIGGGLGLGLGAAGGNPQWDSAFTYAFQACMQGYVLY
jgi:hypothetical protein